MNATGHFIDFSIWQVSILMFVDPQFRFLGSSIQAEA